ncbi:atrial natriuretic peptide-converting enzyme, partial [Agrilus planipennis]|uniref:Atrial natriuretic peptide-converting enzyme n=1 Tax=Agrilus planipennis TaxID=224129 RepID=A0A7F5RN29_AGRPL
GVTKFTCSQNIFTVAMDHKNGRNGSWDSKMSVSSGSTHAKRFRKSSSSILSSDSDIRFTRRKLSSQYKCGCCIIAAFLLLLLLASASVYVGYTFFVSHIPDEQVYRGTFKVANGDTFQAELTDPSSQIFQEKSRDYRERLNLLFRRSFIRYGFDRAEILAFDGNEDEDLIIHFSIYINPVYVNIKAKDLEMLLAKDINSKEPIYFPDIVIDPDSLEIVQGELIPRSTTVPSTKPSTKTTTQLPPPPRKCVPTQITYCSKVNYNVTSFPNIFGHNSIKDVMEDFISFRELVDAECYRSAFEFICQTLQPPCKKGEDEDEMVLPCRSFCREFLSGCGDRLLPKYKNSLDCSRFPEFQGKGSCITKPDCVQEMQSRALSPRICDGVIDCQDLSDEFSCSYCPSDHVHCGVGRVCIHPSKRCDGRVQCPDGSDERGCLSLAPSVANVTSANIVTPHLPRYHSEGFVTFNEKGQVGKLCAETPPGMKLGENETSEVLHTVAASLCKTLTFKKLLSVSVEIDQEPNVPYVVIKEPKGSQINFVRSECPSKQVLKVECSDIVCGIQTTRPPSAGINGLSKMSSYGDWPWHTALFKQDVHVCDGTLVSPDWVITTASCFQGQPKAEWSVRLGTIRITSSSPWQQERRIVGMVKSPVEGSTIAMVKLEYPVALTDFVRPVCLPEDDKEFLLSNATYCNALGWSRMRGQLQRVQIQVANMDKCENVSISTANSLCTGAVYGENDCSEEEYAGSPMLCLLSSARWALVGVTNWRIGCSMGRPRMYDKITSNADWIRETINSISR